MQLPARMSEHAVLEQWQPFPNTTGPETAPNTGMWMASACAAAITGGGGGLHGKTDDITTESGGDSEISLDPTDGTMCCNWRAKPLLCGIGVSPSWLCHADCKCPGAGWMPESWVAEAAAGDLLPGSPDLPGGTVANGYVGAWVPRGLPGSAGRQGPHFQFAGTLSTLLAHCNSNGEGGPGNDSRAPGYRQGRPSVVSSTSRGYLRRLTSRQNCCTVSRRRSTSAWRRLHPGRPLRSWGASVGTRFRRRQPQWTCGVVPTVWRRAQPASSACKMCSPTASGSTCSSRSSSAPTRGKRRQQSPSRKGSAILSV